MITKLTQHCPICNKAVTLTNELNLGQCRLLTYSCKHTISKPLEKSSVEKLQEITFGFDHQLYPFQVEAADFCRKAGFRALLNLDTGTGKTIVSAALLAVHAVELSPTLIVCKSALKAHWARCILNITKEISEVISDGNDGPSGLFPITIISFDLVRKYNPECFKHYKTLIIDETQNIKNSSTARTKALREVARNIPYVIGCSATPIKNHAGEYYSILNILRPDMFGNERDFNRYYVKQIITDKGWLKPTGLKNPDYFHDRTKDFIIRMKREDVLPQLPKINRTPFFTDLGEVVQKAYDRELKAFTEDYDSGKFEGNSGMLSIIEYLTKMRHLTGLSKIKPVTEQIEEFLETTDRKLVVFLHHKDVSNLLERALKGIENPTEVTILDAKRLSDEGQKAVDKFINSTTSRVALVSTIAGGEGLNFQPISDCIIMERQWNPANEEQAESRFPRPGATAESISVSYTTAIGTIDEYFSELVEKKRAYCNQAIDNQDTHWEESSLIRELADILASQGRKKWKW